MAGRELAPDWILQQALGVQNAAHNAFIQEKGLGKSPEAAPQDDQPPPRDENAKIEDPALVDDDPLEGQSSYTLGVIDCRDEGAAIVHSIIDHINQNLDGNSQDPDAFLTGAPSKTSRTPKDLSVAPQHTETSTAPQRIPRSFHVSFSSKERHQNLLAQIPAEKRRQTLEAHGPGHVKVADASDIILLSCSADALPRILEAEDHQTDSIYMTVALENKIVISAIPDGPTLSELDLLINGKPGDRLERPATIVRVEMNPATVVREGITVIARPTRSSSQPNAEVVELVTWIFERVGKVNWVPEAQLKAATALCGAGPSFVTVMAEALANGAIGMGLEPKMAHEMVAQLLKGTAGLLQQNGTHPAVLRESIATAESGSARGVMVLEESGLRSSVAKAVKEVARGSQ